MDIRQIKSLSELARYWATCLTRLEAKTDENVAYDMTAIAGNPHWDEWYDEGKGDPYFVRVFDLVADLETPIVRELSREDAWKRVKELVAEMAEKYNQ